MDRVILFALMIPDRLQYFLEYFWNDHKCDQNMDPRTLYLSQKHFKKSRNMGTPSKNILFQICESENLICWKVCVPIFLELYLGILEVVKFEILKYEI